MTTAIELAIEKHEEDCKEKVRSNFFTYRNAFFGIVAIFVTACAVVFYVSDRFGKVETRISTIEVQTKYIADKVDKIIDFQQAKK